jgi:hypothetical protein
MQRAQEFLRRAIGGPAVPGGLALLALALMGAAAAMAAIPLTAAPPGLAAAPAAKRIAAGEAARHVGEEAMVCGLVAGARYAANAPGKPTFLDFGGVYPQEVFTVVIWGVERSHFMAAPERTYDRRQVCVTGKIQLYRGKPEIVVKDPAQLVLDNVIQDPQ